MSQDKFIEAIGGAMTRGPIVKIATLASRLQAPNAAGQSETIMTYDGDLIMPVETAVRLHGTLSALMEQLVKQGVLTAKQDNAPINGSSQ